MKLRVDAKHLKIDNKYMKHLQIVKKNYCFQENVQLVAPTQAQKANKR